MSTPVSKEVLLAYLAAKHGDAEKIIAENLAETRSMFPYHLTAWMAEFLSQSKFNAADQYSVTAVAELMAALESMPALGHEFKAFVKEAQVTEMCNTYRYLADEWNWKEGPASKIREAGKICDEIKR